jgi:transcriptional regulator with GAF, ATPase, and Fis domain
MEQAIDSNSDVLITGETGTGKELVAQAIHDNSSRRDQPLLAFNCGAMPREALVSDLFGHCTGAFTGALEDKVGLFEAASGGTVILDDIGDTPLDVQSNLLQVLQVRKVRRLGETISRDVDVRVIAITNRDLTKEVEAGRFREDLYYRLNQFSIHLPPLRERLRDIPLLAEHFLREACNQTLKVLEDFSPDVFEMLQSYHWPGNIRELRAVVRRACLLAEEDAQIQINHLPFQITSEGTLI